MSTQLLKVKFEELLVDLGITGERREGEAHEVELFRLAFMHGVNAKSSVHNHVVTGFNFAEGDYIKLELYEVVGSVCAFELHNILTGVDTKEFDVVLKWAKSLVGKTVRMKVLSTAQYASSCGAVEIIENEG